MKRCSMLTNLTAINSFKCYELNLIFPSSSASNLFALQVASNRSHSRSAVVVAAATSVGLFVAK